MCLGAIYWARPDKVYFANSKEDAAKIGFDDKFIYEELSKPFSERKLFTRRLHLENAVRAFTTWDNNPDKIEY